MAAPAASSDTPSSSLTIFVSIIAYRDSETRHTIDSLYRNATHPDRIYCGIVWQYSPHEDTELLFHDFDLSQYPTNHIRQLFLKHTEARGPCYARYLAQEYLFGGGKRREKRKSVAAEASTSSSAASSTSSPSSTATISRSEDFYLQLDSHMRLSPGWDVDLIQEWQACQHPLAVLTAYPPGYERETTTTASSNANNIATTFSSVASSSASTSALPTAATSSASASSAPPLLCASHFDAKDGMLRFVGRLLKPSAMPTSPLASSSASTTAASSVSSAPSFSSASTPLSPRPLPTLYYAAGFCFGPSSMITTCPYDPHLENLFFGEELSMLARLWTNGYEMFTPTKNYVRHCWTREYRPSFRENHRDLKEYRLKETIARSRVQVMLGLPQMKIDQEVLAASTSSSSFDPALLTPQSPYALGTVRTLAEFEFHCGCNFAERTVTQRAKSGGIDESLFLQPAASTQRNAAQLDLVMKLLQQQQLMKGK